MTFSRSATNVFFLCATLSLCQVTVGHAPADNQSEPAAVKPKVAQPGSDAPGATIQSINDDYNRQLLELERQRLDRLARLAAGQPPPEASETYELLFRLAVANNLFREAEPIADRVLKSDGSSPAVTFLAHTLNIIAEADRGAYEESLADLCKVIGRKAEQRGTTTALTPVLDTPGLLALCEAYYQRLLQGARFDVARKAFGLILADSDNLAVKSYCENRLHRLEMIGKVAPAIEGTDLDGKPLSLAQFKGDVVLVTFWASWCMACSTEIEWLDSVYNRYRDRGFRIVGVDLDTPASGGSSLESIMPYVRRFVMDHNVRWPSLVNGSGGRDYAKAYGINDIPASALIGRDGTIIHLDLSRKNLDSVIAKAVAR
jgi:thiol-disulfide isomerase/thioredoxin